MFVCKTHKNYRSNQEDNFMKNRIINPPIFFDIRTFRLSDIFRDSNHNT